VGGVQAALRPLPGSLTPQSAPHPAAGLAPRTGSSGMMRPCARFLCQYFKKSRWSPINGNIGYIENLSAIEIKFRKKFRQKMTHFVQESTEIISKQSNIKN
jgi:hypothetical protein